MAFIVKGLKTLRNNWKKSVAFAGLAAYGVDFGKGKYEDSLLRKAYCLEAKKYGDVRMGTGDPLKKITVFLNPAARNGKGRKVFDANVAPILHLAGFEVRVVKTEYEGQAKKYMEVLDEGTDAIVVAGGDGTLVEVLTGLLRRPDADSYAKVPIGFIPMGYTNTVAQSLFHRGRSDAQWQVEAAMAVVKGLTQPQDVLHIRNEEERNVYALSTLEKGIMTDIKKRKLKNWYMGPLKHKWAYFRESIRNWPREIKGELHYTAPCGGCSKCYVAPPQIVWKWWHIFLPPQRAEVKDFSNVVNKDCGEIYSESIETIQLDIKATKEDNGERAVVVSIAPKGGSRTDFIQRGWAYESDKSKEIVEKKIKAGQVVFTPKVEEGKEEFYLIDNEQFEVMPVEVSVQKDRLNMYCSQPDKRFIELEQKGSSWLSSSPSKLFKNSS